MFSYSTLPRKKKRFEEAPMDREAFRENTVPPVRPEPSTAPELSPAMAVSPDFGVQPRTPVQETQSEIDRIQTKDYSIRKDDEGNVVHRGKDRDKKWSIGDKVMSFLSGMFDGTGAIPAAMDRNYMEKKADQRELSHLRPRLTQQQQAEDFQRDQQYKQGQIDDIPINNELKQAEIDVRRQIAADRASGTAVTALYRGKYFDPKNPAHANLAKRAGLDPEMMKGWDDRDPKVKQVAGVTYRWDYGSQAFVPTNIPVDDSKTLTDYKVEMPDGEVRTFKIAQKDAANFATQMHALGARLQQQESQFRRRLALDEQKFAQAKSQFERVHALRQQAEARGDTKAAREYVEMLTKMALEAEKSRNEGELNDEQYDALTSIIGTLR